MESGGPFRRNHAVERHPRVKNLSDGTVASYLVGVRRRPAQPPLAGNGLDALPAAAGVAPLAGGRGGDRGQPDGAYEPADRPRHVPVVPEDALRRLPAVYAGKRFEARRDAASVTFLLDTSARRGEVAGLRLTDLDFDLGVVLVLGKGRRERALPFGRTSTVALDRYLRVRTGHKDAEVSWLWLGLLGRLTAWGLVQMLRRRSRQAGRPELHPHQVRHTFAHQWLAQGGGRDRPDAAGRLEVPRHVAAVRRLGSRRPRAQGPPSPVTCRPALTATET